MRHKPDDFRTAFPYWFCRLSLGLVVPAALLVILGSQAHTQPAASHEAKPEMQLEAAIHQEIVLGDLPGAIAQYRAILAAPARNRGVSARALLQIAQCQEKQGLRREAFATYRRAASEFADQPAIAAEARWRLGTWQESQPGPQNLKFEEGTPGKVPPGWFVPSLPKDQDYLAELRRDGCRSHVGCALVLVPANAPRPVGTLMQSFSADAFRGKTVRLGAWLRVEGADPDDRGQMWLTVDRANRKVGFSDNMDDRPVRPLEWTWCEITGEIDQDAQFIVFGFMSIGRGRVWVDDVSFEIVK